MHRQVPCPWSLKGTVMRVLTERLRDRDIEPPGRDEGLRRARLGAGAARPGRCRSFTFTRKARRPRRRQSSRPSCAGWSRRSCRPRAPRLRRKLKLRLSSSGPLLDYQRLHSGRKAHVEPFPDLGSLSDDDLKQLIDELTKEELEVSYRRRILHGKIDLLRAELQAQQRRTGERACSRRSTSTGSPPSSPQEGSPARRRVEWPHLLSRVRVPEPRRPRTTARGAAPCSLRRSPARRRP